MRSEPRAGRGGVEGRPQGLGRRTHKLPIIYAGGSLRSWFGGFKREVGREGGAGGVHG